MFFFIRENHICLCGKRIQVNIRTANCKTLTPMRSQERGSTYNALFFFFAYFTCSFMEEFVMGRIFRTCLVIIGCVLTVFTNIIDFPITVLVLTVTNFGRKLIREFGFGAVCRLLIEPIIITIKQRFEWAKTGTKDEGA